MDRRIGSARGRTTAAAALRYFALVLITISTLFPFYWVVASSLKDTNKIIMEPLAPPRSLKAINYVSAWVKAKIDRYFVNSVIVSFSTVFCVLLFGSMASYILSKVHTSLLLLSYFSLGIMIPIHTMLLPSFVILKTMGIYNTRLGLVLVMIGYQLSLSIVILVGFMRSIPNEIEEAAVVDGASRWRRFFTLIMPLAKPGLATAGILSFLTAWNDYLLPLVLITDQEKKVLSQGIQELKRAYEIDLGLMTAGIVIAAVPVIIVYILFQEYIVKGMTAGAVKG